MKCQVKDLVRAVPKAKAKDDAGPAPMEVDATVTQPKKTWVEMVVQGARPSAKAKMTPVPKAEPKGKAASVSEAKNAPAPKAEAKETKQAEPKVEVKKEKMGGVDAPGGSRGSAEGQKRERKSRWDPDETVKESTKREASTRPDDVDSRPGAAAREASGDDLHSALGRSSAKDAVAPLTSSKAMAKKPGGGEIRLQSAERTAASPVEGHFLVLPGDALLAVSTNTVLNKQVRDFIRNGEDASALEALNQIVTNSRSGRRRRESDVSRTPSRRSVRTVDTRDSRESRRRRYRPRREDDRDRRRDDARDRRDDDSLDRERDRRRDDRRRSERDRDRDRTRGGRDRRRRDDSR